MNEPENPDKKDSEKAANPAPPKKKGPSVAQKILNRKKDPTLQKKLQAETLDFESKADAEINAAVQKSKLQARANKTRKTRLKQGGLAIAAVFLSYVGYGLFKPYQAGLTFGVCKIFLELNTRYPHTLRLSTVEELNDFVRIWYTQTNAFGEYKLENIQCHFEADEKTGGRLSKISINRRAVDPERVAAFNKMLPIIFENPPDLTYPRPISNRLEDMKIQTHLFRKPIL